VFSRLRLRESSESGGSYLLLPNRFLVARWCERDPQVLLVPTPNTFGPWGSEEQFSDPHYFSISVPPANPCLIAARAERGEIIGRTASLRCFAELVPAQHEARPERK